MAYGWCSEPISQTKAKTGSHINRPKCDITKFNCELCVFCTRDNKFFLIFHRQFRCKLQTTIKWRWRLRKMSVTWTFCICVCGFSLFFCGKGRANLFWPLFYNGKQCMWFCFGNLHLESSSVGCWSSARNSCANGVND